MEGPSKFARLRQRDTSVDMLRVKLSRRRSQSQKENRERAVNTRRQLDHVPEMDSTLDTSMAVNITNVKETCKPLVPPAKTSAATQRLEQLKKWKEDKILQKEKEKREKERKGVFKVGLFHPNDTFSLKLPAATVARPRETQVKVPQTRVTRSTKPNQQPKEPVMGRLTRSRTALVQPQPIQATTKAKAVHPAVQSTAKPRAVQPTATRGKVVSRAEPVARAAVHTSSNLDKPGGGRTRGNAKPVAPSTGRGRNRVIDKTVPAQSEVVVPAQSEVVVPALSEVVVPALSEVVDKTVPVVSEEQDCADKESNRCVEEEEEVFEAETVVEESALSDTLPPRNSTAVRTSFAPKGFVFEAPAGVSTFKFEPFTPRTADAFLRPSPNFDFPPVPLFGSETSVPSPPKSPHRSPQAPAASQEPQHDVPYFRSQVTAETDRLTSLCQLWEVKVDDDTIPEEMRDSMRTAVGQARLLMKERFGQFLGLVDDCELGRGEKLTTCMDLQGFWEMVYFQVEDVFRKFDALKEAEARCWVEERKPPPRRRKVVKKPPPTAAPAAPKGTNAEAKSRLAAVKAAMKAKQQAAEAEKAVDTEESPSIQVSEAPTVTQATDTVVFNGGFFKVESPAKHAGSLSRLGATTPSQASSPSGRVTRQSIAMSHLSPLNHSSPDHRRRTPARHTLALPHTPCTQSEHCTVTEAANSPETACRPVQDGEEPEIGSQPLWPRLSPAPCIPTSPSSQAPEPDLSFTVSTAPTVVCAQESTNYTPDSSVVEDAPGLDMDRYLHPSQSFSPSPRDTEAMETSLPLDVEMASPIARHGDDRTQEDADMPSTDLDQVFPPQLPQAVFIEAQNAASDLLLFTPDLRDRIRQSVCPNDLMVFTPPQ